MTEQLPQPKHSIGDNMFYASIEYLAEELQCPDCLDTGVWRQVTPAGGDFECECPRCHGEKDYQGNRIPYKMTKVYPKADAFIIMGIDVQKRYKKDGYSISYKSKSHFSVEESKLFTTEQEAMEQAVKFSLAEAKKQYERSDENVRNARLRGLTIVEARVSNAEKKEWDAVYRCDEILEAIKRACGSYIKREDQPYSIDDEDVKAVVNDILSRLDEEPVEEDEYA